MPDMETMSESFDEDREIQRVTAGLAEQFRETQMAREIGPAVTSEFKRYDQARIREFVPVLVERRLRANLRRLERD